MEIEIFKTRDGWWGYVKDGWTHSHPERAELIKTLRKIHPGVKIFERVEVKD